ncbi:ABC transporter ATP-binding protein [Sphaerisporangium sp. TRM90804]|uniref:ABC transporter ATP-binding protein n=1 Tax=Sphaerisporangium sp. TRM90804 TaxID=3031113 RepID=UPI002449746E|nr:ABC transporter ATP-binding protein [Sphaerisporangium sp. TRM90804]MDH2427694.1 ABC transporter ATP-binding protein [Sphaerisporangium sp. TRM90804]
MITFEGVTKRFGDGTVAVDNLNLQVPTGAVTVFVGPSGCGKTTSLRMINRMIDPTEGRILLDGEDIRKIDPPALRRGIGYVIQAAGLFPHRKIVDNVATVPYLLGWDKKKARARAMELMERVGLDTKLAERYPFQLSGGQQQRVGVARALAADPPVLLMDEPFSAVDPVVRTSLQDELLRLQAELQKTIVFVTHDIDEAIKLGDTVAVMRVGGRLAQIDDPPTLLAEPADDFVEGFLGKDRGIRRLSFVPAGGLAVRSEQGIPGWSVVLDDDRRPLGWRAEGGRPSEGNGYDSPAKEGDPLEGPVLNGTRPERPPAGEARTRAAAAGLQPFGTVDLNKDSLRAALDAALLAPSGCAIAVDGEGRFTGIVTREALDAALARATGPADG